MVLDEKKGQVTIFVILGLIVFILVYILFLTIFQDDERPRPEEEFITDYPSELAPLVNNIEYCLSDLTKEALIEIGLQGGYLDTSLFRYDLEPSFLNSALELFPNSGQVVPYWFYSSNNPGADDVSFNIVIPSLDSGTESIKMQVQKVLEEEILSCINHFRDHEEIFSVSAPDPRVNIVFRDGDVLIELFWDLEFDFYEADLEANVNKFSSRLDLDFKGTFEIAQQLFYNSQIYSEVPFLEGYTLKLLEIISAGGKNAVIPPIGAYTDFEFGVPEMWFLGDVEKILKTELADISGFLQVKNSYDSFIPLTNDPYDSLIYSSFVYSLSGVSQEKLGNTRISFDYMPLWPMFVNVNPGYGPVITASPSFEFGLLGLNIAITDYKFYYDIAYPVLVTVEDPFAFGGDGFIFRYAVEVNINKNNPFLTDLEDFDYEEEELDFEAFDGFGYITQRTIPLDVRIINGYDGSPIEGFELGYSCFDATIPVGVSELRETGASSVRGSVPPCIGGELHSLDNTYYLREPLDAELGESYDLILQVFPEKEIVVRPRKNLFEVTPLNLGASPSLEQINSREWNLMLSDDGQSLAENEELTIIFMKQDDPSFFRSVELAYPETEASITLLPGKYEFMLLAEKVLEEPFILERREFEGGDIVFNETQINGSALIGGLFFEAPDNLFEITVDDLRYSNFLNVLFPSFRLEHVMYHPDLQVMGDVMSMDEELREHFTPTFYN